MIEPTVDWQWCADDEQNALCLHMGPSLYFVSGIAINKINTGKLSCDNDGLFTLEQMGDFHHFMTALETLPGMADAERLQAVLNALGAKHFGREVGLKSWFFDTCSEGCAWEVGPMSVTTSEGNAIVMVVEQHGNAATCILLSKHLQLNNDKSLQQFSLLKVMNDRLSPLIGHSEQVELCRATG